MNAATENILTIMITAASLVVLFYLGAGGHSFWTLLMLLNLNTKTFN